MLKLKYGIGGSLGCDEPIPNGKDKFITQELSLETVNYYNFKYMLGESMNLTLAVQLSVWLHAELEMVDK